MPAAKTHTASNAMVSSPPGFAAWITSTSLTNGGDLAQLPKFDVETGGFAHHVTIKHSDAFELEPLTITEGPLRGSHALVLKPFTRYFRFLELPLEIRRLIYDELLVDPKPIVINSQKPKDEPRRAISIKYAIPREGVSWDTIALKWKPRSPNYTLGIMAVNRQLLQEASVTMYSGNTFEFDKFSTCQIFLADLGSMRGHLRHIAFSAYAYQKTKARGMFFKLKDATGVRSVSLSYLDFDHHSIWLRHAYTAETLAADCKTMMMALQRSRKGGSSLRPVLDLLKVTFCKCSDCCIAKKDGSSCIECIRRSKRSSALQRQVRQAVAESLGLDE